MPRVADAERAVNEHLNLQGRVFNGFKQIDGRRFACDDDAAKTNLFELLGGERIVRRCLCACVQFKTRIGAVQSRRHTKVSNNERIYACVCCFFSGCQCGRDFAVAYKGVECQIHLYAIAMRAQNGGAQCVSAEIVGIHSCIKRGAAEINGIGTAFNCCFKCLRRTRGAEQLGQGGDALIRHH